jgi:hypothetical protein
MLKIKLINNLFNLIIHDLLMLLLVLFIKIKVLFKCIGYFLLMGILVSNNKLSILILAKYIIPLILSKLPNTMAINFHRISVQ